MLLQFMLLKNYPFNLRRQCLLPPSLHQGTVSSSQLAIMYSCFRNRLKLSNRSILFLYERDQLYSSSSSLKDFKLSSTNTILSSCSSIIRATSLSFFLYETDLQPKLSNFCCEAKRLYRKCSVFFSLTPTSIQLIQKILRFQ